MRLTDCIDLIAPIKQMLVRRVLAPVVAATLLATAIPAMAASPLAVNAMEYPWSAIGRINTGGRGFCTGFLVSERHAITAAHCLYNEIEGRWWNSSELHFVAGYQHDRTVLNARIVGHTISDRFDIRLGGSKVAANRDWAVITLDRPLGREAGWLGLHSFDSKTHERLKRGEAIAVQAGYRKGWENALSANLNCAVTATFFGGDILYSCADVNGMVGAPLMMFSDGQFRVIGMHVKGTQNVGVAMSISVLHPDSADRKAAGATQAAQASWRGGRAPGDGGVAAAVPVDTIGRLRGLVSEKSGGVEQTSARADDVRLLQNRQPSLALLGDLIRAYR